MATKKMTIVTDDELEITLKPPVAGHTKITVSKPNLSEIRVAQGLSDGTPAGADAASDYLYEKATGLTSLDLAVMPVSVIEAIDSFLASKK